MSKTIRENINSLTRSPFFQTINSALGRTCPIVGFATTGTSTFTAAHRITFTITLLFDVVTGELMRIVCESCVRINFTKHSAEVRAGDSGELRLQLAVDEAVLYGAIANRSGGVVGLGWICNAHTCTEQKYHEPHQSRNWFRLGLGVLIWGKC